MEFFGYFAALLIGVSLGLMGGGGSILTVPVLVYLFHQDAGKAMLYSLFIVGVTSAAGSLRYYRNQLVDLKAVLLFGIPSMLSTILTRAFLLPSIPATISFSDKATIGKATLLMILFALLMLTASYKMIRSSVPQPGNMSNGGTPGFAGILAQGVFTGFITALVGAGGGFIIIPALVFLLRLPMKKAVGTSLVIITLNSLLGFFSSAGTPGIDWSLLLIISAIAVAGILIGSRLSLLVDEKKLKPAFGWFILLMGLYIIGREIFFH